MTVLEYKSSDGKIGRKKFHPGDSSISLSFNGILSLDLSQLTSCRKLDTLSLNGNRIKKIELEAISSCTKLQRLNLSYNQLETIDLSPLSSCSELRELLLSGNELTYIDLAPLSSCSNLRKLSLHYNQLKSLNLTPLSSCTQLESLHLSPNQLEKLDITPLFACNQLATLELDPSVTLEADYERKLSKGVPPALEEMYSRIQWMDSLTFPSRESLLEWVLQREEEADLHHKNQDFSQGQDLYSTIIGFLEKSPRAEELLKREDLDILINRLKAKQHYYAFVKISERLSNLKKRAISAANNMEMTIDEFENKVKDLKEEKETVVSDLEEKLDLLGIYREDGNRRLAVQKRFVDEAIQVLQKRLETRKKKIQEGLTEGASESIDKIRLQDTLEYIDMLENDFKNLENDSEKCGMLAADLQNVLIEGINLSKQLGDRKTAGELEERLKALRNQ